MSESEIMLNFGTNLGNLLEKNKIGVSEFSRKTGIHRRLIYKYLDFSVLPRIERMVKIADTLGVTINDLIYLGE